jgi:hypothetical protein
MFSYLLKTSFFFFFFGEISFSPLVILGPLLHTNEGPLAFEQLITLKGVTRSRCSSIIIVLVKTNVNEKVLSLLLSFVTCF